ncbi:MAG: hypothetical protein OXH12_05645, partial [Chloroflexi bacterium]|nr:hypothetical protein [Chloroflexota bacterium]
IFIVAVNTKKFEECSNDWKAVIYYILSCAIRFDLFLEKYFRNWKTQQQCLYQCTTLSCVPNGLSLKVRGEL